MYGALKKSSSPIAASDDGFGRAANRRNSSAPAVMSPKGGAIDGDEEDVFGASSSTDAIVGPTSTRGRSDGWKGPPVSATTTTTTKTGRRFVHPVKLYVICQGLIQLSYLILGSYLKSVITSIERRFDLDSATAGFMSSGFEIGNLIVILPVSYFGRRIHRPRAIAIGVWFMMAGGLLLATPHWIYGPYRPNGGGGGGGGGGNGSSAANITEGLCRPDVDVDVPLDDRGLASPLDSPSVVASQRGIWRLMFFARVLVGIGAAPVQPYGVCDKERERAIDRARERQFQIISNRNAYAF